MAPAASSANMRNARRVRVCLLNEEWEILDAYRAHLRLLRGSLVAEGPLVSALVRLFMRQYGISLFDDPELLDPTKAADAALSRAARAAKRAGRKRRKHRRSPRA